MLGSLARKLRMLGLDVLYDPDADDALVRYRSRLESRLVLTRDARLAGTLGSMAHLVTGNGVDEEFASTVLLLRRLDCHYHPLNRCLDCNLELSEVGEDKTVGRVPRFVLATSKRLLQCSGCRKIYWAGTHSKRMLKEIGDMLEEIGQHQPDGSF